MGSLGFLSAPGAPPRPLRSLPFSPDSLVTSPLWPLARPPSILAFFFFWERGLAFIVECFLACLGGPILGGGGGTR